MLGMLGIADEELRMMIVGGGLYVVLALFAGVVGALHVFTGVKLRAGTGLLWVLASFAAGLASLVLALYCSPFTLGVLVYTAVVLIDPDVREALDPAPT
ncbi:MAG: hypothetical protein R3F61_05030 [Myxococcota bacterium]